MTLARLTFLSMLVVAGLSFGAEPVSDATLSTWVKGYISNKQLDVSTVELGERGRLFNEVVEGVNRVRYKRSVALTYRAKAGELRRRELDVIFEQVAGAWGDSPIDFYPVGADDKEVSAPTALPPEPEKPAGAIAATRVAESFSIHPLSAVHVRFTGPATNFRWDPRYHYEKAVWDYPTEVTVDDDKPGLFGAKSVARYVCQITATVGYFKKDPSDVRADSSCKDGSKEARCFVAKASSYCKALW